MPGFLRRHIAEGGRAAVLEPGERGGTLTLYSDGAAAPVTAAADIPLTLGGLARYNVQNALAALAAAAALGVAPEVAAAGLAALSDGFEDSPGRLNSHVFRRTDGEVRVLLDYAHNPAGLSALRQVIDGLRDRHETVIGLVSIPGDRRDEDILQMGELAASVFDRLIFREKPDGRGRQPGEVLRLLTQGALGSGFDPERLSTVPSEAGAVDCALKLAAGGDLVVLLPTDIDSVWRQVLAFQPAASPQRENEAKEAVVHV